MDPDAQLAQVVESARTVVALEGVGSPAAREHAALRLADGFLELHEWLRKGGFPPNEWLPAHLAGPETTRQIAERTQGGSGL